MNKRTHAFTLVELLIVVLIIAILAALAVPNFIEFQVRAKVSRVKADMRSLATAIEAYAIDYSEYPIPADEDGNTITDYPAGGPNFFETRVSQAITTPIAYISNRLNEPFPGRDLAEDPLFHYSTIKYANVTDGQLGKINFQMYINDMAGTVGQIKYFILSHGPDMDHDAPTAINDGDTIVPSPSLYDPTNGTYSSGDIVSFGFGMGVRD